MSHRNTRTGGKKERLSEKIARPEVCENQKSTSGQQTIKIEKASEIAEGVQTQVAFKTNR